MQQPSTIREKALYFLRRELKHARISLGRAEQKNGTEAEKQGLKNKTEVLEWLTEIVLKEG